MQLRHPDYDRELTELVRSNLSPKAFREKLLDYHENDIAAALETLTLSERQRIYHALDAAELSAVLEYAEPMTPYLNELSLRRRVDVLSRMDADAAVDYLKTLESSEKNTLVELMDEPKRREIARLWVYGEDEIGSIMTTNCIVIPEGLSVKEAMSRLSERERQILALRYSDGKTQMEVASEIGISQAQVSRIEKGALDTIKKNI